MSQESPSSRVFTWAFAALVLATASSFTASFSARAQNREQNLEQSATYVSQIDQDLTIRRIAILPVSDNVDGIYARPIEAQLTQLLKASHRWDFVETHFAGQIPAVIDLEESPTEVDKLTRSIEADAFIAAAASRGPNGLSLRLDLFLKKDGKLLSQEILRDHPRFELAEIRERVTDLYRKVIARIPYEGILLSRQQNRVTINLGKSDGLKKDQMITAVQILSVSRHPKFNFLVSSEKEILGRIKILKVDETLSFGAIVAEKERGAIRKLAKVAGISQVVYSDTARLDDGGATDVNSRADAAVTFGKEPKEWLPVRPPSFGLIGAKLGFGGYNSSLNLGSTGTYEAKSSFYPLLGLYGELWLSPEWFLRADILQGILSTDNPRANSQPSTLNHALSRYSLEIGYNFLLRDDFFGPKLFMTGGFSTYQMFVDDSTPRSLTRTTYSGLLIGLGGSFPVSEDKLWYAAGKLNLYLFPSLQESPVTSGGDAKNSISEISVSLERKVAENMRLTGTLDLSLYSTSFSGNGSRTDPLTGNPETASSLSQRHTTLSGGLVYMF